MIIIIGYFSPLKYMKKKPNPKNHVIFANCKKKNERKIIASPNVVNENKKENRTSFSHTICSPFSRKFGQNMFIYTGHTLKGWH